MHTKPKAAFPLLFLFIFLIYSNSFNAAWHLDDFPGLLHNPRLQLTDLTLSGLKQTLFAHPGEPDRLYRPTACLSLGLNWYIGQDRVWGYHLLNTLLHGLSAWLLYLVMLQFFQTPALKDRYTKNVSFSVSLLAAMLWAANPVQTQAVTYIVQRMTVMATLFYLLGMYAYLKGRMAGTFQKKIGYAVLCAAGGLLALGSKENAATFPFALLLLEIIFFNNLRKRKYFLIGIGILGGLFVLAGVIWYLDEEPFSFMAGYHIRPFSMSERLLTEGRVLIFYLSQLFYPIPQRLSIEHDILVSTSFLSPWTTIPALMTVFGLIGLAVFEMRRYPLLAFGILFYFLNQLIESSIIPLELIFEHRNYLPSLFIFLPLAAFLVRFSQQKRLRRATFVAFTSLLLFLLGMGTWVRNLAWQSEGSLWLDARAKAPQSGRPYYNLAKNYYKKIGQFDAALAHYVCAYKLGNKNRKDLRPLALNGMASVYYIQKRYAKVITLCSRALKLDPGFEPARFNRVLARIKHGNWDEASRELETLIGMRPNNRIYLRYMGFILLKQNNPKEARQYLQRALKIKPDDKPGLMYMGISFRLEGKFERAGWFLKQANRILPRNDMETLLNLVENELAAGDAAGAAEYWQRLLDLYPLPEIINRIEKLSPDRAGPIGSKEILSKGLAKILAANTSTIIKKKDML